MVGSGRRPAVTELRLPAFRAHRGLRVPLGPLTLLAGASGSGSGSGKSTVLEAYKALARLGGGESLGEVFGGAHGGPPAYVPQGAARDRYGRRGFRLGCTVGGPAGRVRLDLAVQVEPELRIAGERLADGGGRALLSTALRDPARRVVCAKWHGTGRAGRRGPAVGVRLRPAAGGHARLGAPRGRPAPGKLRQPRGGAAAHPHGVPHPARGAGGGGARRVRGPVRGLLAEDCGEGLVRALVERGGGGAAAPVDRLGDGELRHLALAMVVLTGPGVLEVDPARGVPAAQQALTVLADGLDRGLDGRQRHRLAALAARMCERGRTRLLGAVHDGAAAAAGARLVDLDA